MKIKLIVVLTIIFNSAYSQLLDNSFGANGIVTNQFSTTPSDEIANAAAMQSDGKMVYVGRNFYDGTFFVLRTTIAGALDTSFNAIGYQKLSGVTRPESVVIQSDGKIVVSGSYQVLRFNADGSKDLTFGGSGIKNLIINGVTTYVKSVVIQNDGKILLVGNARNSSGNNDFSAIRLNSDASYDTTFGSGGLSIFDIGAAADEAFGIAVQTDGKIIVTGQTTVALTGYDIATIRLNTNGALDTSFATSGISIVAFSAQDYGRSIDIQADGKILVVGGGTAGKLYVIRYNTNGTLDTSFDGDGKLQTMTNFTTSNSLTGANINRPNIKYLSFGKILLSGNSLNTFGLVQLNSDGSLDATFGTGGNASQSFGNNNYSNILIVKPDGKILTGGGSSDNPYPLSYRIQLAQFSSTGVFDSSTSNHLNLGSDEIKLMIEQSAGKTITVSQNRDGNKLHRFDSSGVIDASFGVNGAVDIGTDFYKISKQNDSLYLSDINNSVYKLTANGQPDVTFGVNGIVDFNINVPNIVSFIDDIYFNPNDNFLYVAFTNDDSSIPNYYFFNAGLLRLNSHGILDTSFGVNGYSSYRFDLYSTTENEYPFDILVQSDGKIVLTAFLQDKSANSYHGLGLIRLNTNGLIDNSFGTNGKFIIQNNNRGFDDIGSVMLPDNKFIINERYYNSNVSLVTATAKFNSNGTVDNSFGINGIALDQSPTTNMIVQPDGKIIKTGTKNNHFNTTRFLANGTLDTSFGNLGELSTVIGATSIANKALWLSSNKLLIGGSASKNNSLNNNNVIVEMAQARYTSLSLGNLTFISNENNILVYPNPIKQNATFEYSLIDDETITINLIDLQGKIVKTFVENKNQLQGNHKVDLELSNEIVSGNYFLNFSTKKGNSSVQIIKID